MRKSQNQPADEPKKKSLYTLKLTDPQLKQLDEYCSKQLWEPYHVDHARFAYKGDKVNVVAYNSGKLVVQGKKTEHFVTYILEGQITKDPRLGYDEVHHPEWFEAHAGLDESGKGDFFGPLITACVIADKSMVEHWVKSGITDSKRITSDASILKLEAIIRDTDGVVIKTAFAGMRKYNELYVKFGSNLNKLLGWFHAKSLQEALKLRRVPWGMLDQFSKRPIVQDYFKDSSFDLRMQTKAESDPVVAAASIVARAEFVRQMNKLSELFGEPLQKGASAKKVKDQARQIIDKMGEDALRDFAKIHFKTATEVLGHSPYES